MAYIFGTSISLVIAFLFQHRDKSIVTKVEKISEKIFMISSCLPLIIVSAFRYQVGTDYNNYYQWYQGTFNYPDNLLEYIIRSLRFISPYPPLFFVISSIFICGITFYVIYKESISPVFSIFLFVTTRGYFRSFNVVRQYLALTIFLLSISAIKNRRTVKFVSIVLFAALIHPSVLILVILYVIQNIKIPPKAVIICGALTYFAGNSIRKSILPIISKTSYGRYFTVWSMYYQSNFNASITLIYFALFLFLALQYKNMKENNNWRLLYNTIIIGIILSLLTAVMPRNYWRSIWYLDMIVTIFLPEAVESVHKPLIRKVLKIAIYLSYTIVAVVYIAFLGEQGVIPYRTLWS